MIQPIDLHVHSTFSDGTMTPTEIVKLANIKNLKAIALTDHDTVAGLNEANKAGEKYGIEIVSGIEFSTTYNDIDIHILGLMINYKDQYFQEQLQQFINSREKRNQKMIEALNKLDINISLDDVKSVSDGNVITRAHFARALFEKRYIQSTQEAFTKYIGNNGPAYVEREKVTPDKVIKLILDNSGIPILAHPLLYGLNNAELNNLIKELLSYGLKGIEGIYSLNTFSDDQYLKKLAHKYNLLISGGSDFHGDNKPNIQLGTGRGNLFIPNTLLERLKNH